METRIVYAEENLIPGFYATLDIVAREQIYLEMIEAPPFAEIEAYQKELIAKNWPVYYAVEDTQVVGFVDISVLNNPRQEHRGNLGMGLIPSHRHRGLGYKLLKRAIDHAAHMGLEKIELKVYTDNLPAIKLYQKMGFVIEGELRKFRKLNNVYFDCLLMAKFL